MTKEQMKMEAVSSAIASFQLSLERQYKVQNVLMYRVIETIVSEYAKSLIVQNGLLELEIVDFGDKAQ